MQRKKNKWKVGWTPIAGADIIEIVAFVSEASSPELANRIALSIHETGDSIARNPYLWRARDEILENIRFVPLAPYYICYRIIDHTVEILRVVHQRRDVAALFAETVEDI